MVGRHSCPLLRHDMRQENTDPFDGMPVQREALAWVARLSSGEATQTDAEDLAKWRARSPAHEEAFRAAARLWRQLGPAMGPPVVVPLRPAASSQFSRRTFLRGGALAAGAAGLALVGQRAGLLPSVAEVVADYRTTTGERRRIGLPDGSVVELNTRTSLSIAFTSAERRIELLSGEAAFTVARDAARPFVVAAAGGTTTAVGTVFTVRAGGGKGAVCCLEGMVEVARTGSARLRAGEQAAYDGGGVGTVARFERTAAAAWRSGLLVFRDEPLAQVVAEINRYRPGHVVVADAAQAARHISGVFHLDRLDEALTHLKGILNLRSLALPGGLLVMG